MLRYFPNFYDDELLYSAIARYHKHVANEGYKTTLLELFGVKSVCASVDIPSHLLSLAARLRPKDPNYAENILFNHTLYPYYARFLSLHSAAETKNDMYGSNGSGIQTRAGIVAFKIRTPRWLKVCSQCIEIEKAKFGETYWHRAHQLPGVYVCPVHECWLCDTDVSYRPRGKHDYIDASEIEALRIPNICFENMSDLIAIAKMSKAFLESQLIAIEYEDLGKQYRKIALAKGFNRGNSIDQKKLEEVFQKRFGALLQLLTGGNKRNYDWLHSLVRKHRRAHHPICHILFRMFAAERSDVRLSRTKRSPAAQLPNAIARQLKRREWLSAMSLSPGVGTSKLRAEFSALYAWLYRHDALWLKCNCPSRIVHVPKSTVDWSQRDKFCCDQLAQYGLDSEKDKPVWRTQSKLLLSLDRPATVSKNRKKLPLTWQMLAALSETRVEFQIRRIEWAAKQLANDHETPQGWQIIRRSGLREPLHPDVQRKVEELVNAGNAFKR